jgi:hypothetical protein
MVNSQLGKRTTSNRVRDKACVQNKANNPADTAQNENLCDDIQSRMDHADLLIKKEKQTSEIYQPGKKIRTRKTRMGRGTRRKRTNRKERQAEERQM